MELCYRPLRIEGREGEIRSFYFRFYSERQNMFESTLPNLTAVQYDVINNYVQEFVEANDIWRKYVFQKYLVYNIYISLWRIKNNHPFPKEELRTKGIKLPFGDSYKELKKSSEKSWRWIFVRLFYRIVCGRPFRIRSYSVFLIGSWR